MSDGSLLIDTFTATRQRAQVSVLMPVHNEADIIEEVALDFYKTISVRVPVEIVLSEDGSTDGTREVIGHLAKQMPLKATLSPARKGYARGIKYGLELVSADYVLITDSDGQLGALDFWNLWDLRAKFDIVSGCRINRADSPFRKFMSDAFQRMNRSLIGLPKFRDVTSPYKLMKTEVARLIADGFRYMNESFWTEFTVRAVERDYSITEIPVNHMIRKNGATRVYKLSKIPRIVLSQFSGLLKLWWELREP
ncbi:MAG TPA: glycosyltransferase family 2 protein [Candidatus Bathyarchaeia archaeon]|nr:glycosyltransferase family 2 protein [Candidatus Bathyarchaeia archaeon]